MVECLVVQYSQTSTNQIWLKMITNLTNPSVRVRRILGPRGLRLGAGVNKVTFEIDHSTSSGTVTLKRDPSGAIISRTTTGSTPSTSRFDPFGNPLTTPVDVLPGDVEKGWGASAGLRCFDFNAADCRGALLSEAVTPFAGVIGRRFAGTIGLGRRGGDIAESVTEASLSAYSAQTTSRDWSCFATRW